MCCYKQEKHERIKSNLENKLKKAPTFIADYFYTQDSAATSNCYWTYIRDLLEWLINNGYIQKNSIKEITPSDMDGIRQANVQRYLNDLKRGNGCKKISQDSVSVRKNIYSAFWGWMERNHYVKENVVYELQYKKKKRRNSNIKVPSKEQMENFISNIDMCGSDFLKYRNRAIIFLFSDSGIRSEELLTLNIDDVCFDKNHPYVTILGKGYYEEDDKEKVYISRVARDAIVEYLKYRKDNCKNETEEALFISEWGNRLSKTSMTSFFKRYSNGQINPHMLRHYCGSKLYKDTNNIMLVKEHLRHSSVKITERHYVKIEESDLAMAICGK